jgi:hypothetical protein
MTHQISRSTHHTNTSSVPTHRGLLSREKLERLAHQLHTVDLRFGSHDHNMTDEVLQNRCFTVVFEMCETGQWDVLNTMRGVLEGIRDSSGNTIITKYICDKGDTKHKDKFEKMKDKSLITTFAGEESGYLHLAVRYRRSPAFLQMLGNTGVGIANGCETDSKGRRPIYLAVRKDHAAAIPTVVPMWNDNRLPLTGFTYYSHKKGMELCPVSLAIYKGHTKCIDELVKLGVVLAAIRIGPDNKTLFHLAIERRQHEMLEHLFREHTDQAYALLDISDKQCVTPLMLAALLANRDALKLLIEKGANLNARDLQGRTVVHYAVMGNQEDCLIEPILRILVKEGAQLDPQDFSNNPPAKYLGEGHIILKKVLESSGKQSIDKEKKHKPYVPPQPENLVFQAGGPRGIAYIGAIRGLEKLGMLAPVKRLAGSSGGALTATLIALGFSADEIQNLFINTPNDYFFDHIFTDKRMKQFVLDTLTPNVQKFKNIVTIITASVVSGSPLGLLTAIGSWLCNSVWQTTGACKGDKLLNWIEAAVYEKTGISRCTFGELAALIAQGKTNPQGRSFKHLHVFALKMVKNHMPTIAPFMSDDVACKNLIISETVQACLSVPLLFEAHVLIFKEQKENRVYEFHTENKTLRSADYQTLKEAIRLEKHKAEFSYIACGGVYSFPIKAFDRVKYIGPSSPHPLRDCEHFNSRTLGFSLTPSKSETVISSQSAENWADILLEMYHVWDQMETILLQLNPDNTQRIVALDHQEITKLGVTTDPFGGKGQQVMQAAEKKVLALFKQSDQASQDSHALDNQGISLLGVGTIPTVGKGVKAIDEAEKNTKECFEKQESEIKGLVPVSIKQTIKGEPKVEKPIAHVALHISEAQADKLLTFGSKAQEYLNWSKACRVADTALVVWNSVLIVTLPLTITGLIFRHEEPKSLESRKLELLSLDDKRFLFFRYLGEGMFKEASAEFTQHQAFLEALMKTYVFVCALKKCLVNCKNIYYRWDAAYNDPLRFRRYMSFLNETKIIPSIIPREFVHELPEL